jgi:LmbE family N-acetylglucosaminyl deacetylase
MIMTETDQLEPLPEDNVRRVLCVVAHPDDMEYGTSAAVAHWTRNGVEVAYLLLTSGEAGMQRPPSEAGPLRADEQRAACDVVGVRDLTILDYPDGVLEPTLELRRDIARVIRQFKPDAVVTASWDIEVPWGLNQADHRVAGLATVDAVAAAGNAWIFPELAEDEGLPPWGATWLLVSGTAQPTHAVVVTHEDIAASVASLESHQAYLADLPDHPAPADFIPDMLHSAGPRLGAAAAVPLRAHRLRN